VTTLATCSCGRAEVELGCDLCAYCRGDYEERQMHREQEAAFNAEQQAEYDAWLNAQAPKQESEPPKIRWDEGPCYICGQNVSPETGWHREDYDGVRRHWCPEHQPVWSRA
jgi:hypothetical protein